MDLKWILLQTEGFILAVRSKVEFYKYRQTSSYEHGYETYSYSYIKAHFPIKIIEIFVIKQQIRISRITHISS